MALERTLEKAIFRSRWIMAPVYLGLSAALIVLVVKFVHELVHIVPQVLSMEEEQVVLACLTLVDIALVGNLLLMVVFAGYENFVSKIDVSNHVDRPAWMGRVDMSGLKIRLIASIVAISSIQILKVFLNLGDYSDRDLMWMVGIHLMFVVSGVLLALVDWIAVRAGDRIHRNGCKPSAPAVISSLNPSPSSALRMCSGTGAVAPTGARFG